VENKNKAGWKAKQSQNHSIKPSSHFLAAPTPIVLRPGQVHMRNNAIDTGLYEDGGIVVGGCG
jgi:hypothetical protein